MAKDNENVTNLLEKEKGDQPTTATEPDKKPDVKMIPEEQVEQIIKDRLAREQAKSLRAQQDAADKAAAEQAVKQGDWQKQAELAAKRAADLENEIKQRDLREKRRSIGVKAGLPEALALRLTGESDEDIEKDAKSILEALPKPIAQPKLSPGPINPGQGGEKGETLAEARARVHGRSAGAFDPAVLAKKGGGVFMPTAKSEKD